VSESKSKVEELRYGARFREQLDGLHRMEEVERLRAAVVEAALAWYRACAKTTGPWNCAVHALGDACRELEAACAALAKAEADQ